jgi:hypothetical protein
VYGEKNNQEHASLILNIYNNIYMERNKKSN